MNSIPTYTKYKDYIRINSTTSYTDNIMGDKLLLNFGAKFQP